jgi:hypothetical protein
MIKKYIEFINEGVYPYGCILLETPIEMYKKIVDFLNQYKNVDIMKYQVERIKTIRK